MNEREFAQKIREIGGTAYRVGGSIRNEILDIPIKDRDYCVTGLITSRLSSFFPNAQRVGHDFPVFLIEIDGEKCEVALARTETKTEKVHTGFEIVSNSSITIDEDLRRRDFTMNAMAWDIIGETLIDPFNGMDDVQNGIIRATTVAFKEDPLRVYRAARFAAQLGFKVEERTIKMMSDARLQKEMETLSSERVVAEFKKAISSPSPRTFFDVLREASCLDVHFKEIKDLIGVPQNELYHPEGDVYEHSMQVLTEISKLTHIDYIRFTGLVHDLGKAKTPMDILPKHHGHEEAGAEPLYALWHRLKLPTVWFNAACFGVINHGKFHHVHEMREVKVVDLIANAKRSPLGVLGFAHLGLADRLGRNGLHKDHPNFEKFVWWSELIDKVKGKKELQGIKAWDDKRKRQAALIKADKKEEVN